MNPPYILMDNRSWNILCWKVRGLNDKDKWDPIRNKIDESEANLFCIQETKKASFDLHFIRKFAPKKFDKFDFCPSEGASGGISCLLGFKILLGCHFRKASLCHQAFCYLYS
jgi:hypothetical protein